MPVARGDSDRVPVADLLAVGTTALLAVAVAFTPAGEFRPLAIVVGVPFVLLVPGYALVSAVFPRAAETAPSSDMSWLGRLGLSVGGSVVAVAVVAGALDFTIWGFQRGPVVLGLAAVSLAGLAVAWYRRRTLPAEVRAGATTAAVGHRTRSLVVGSSWVSTLLTIVVVVAAAGAVGVVAQDTTETGTVTEFYILGQNDAGELVAGSYPENVTAGEPTTVGIGVGTTETDGFSGTVVASLERVTVAGNATRITQSQQLGSFDVQVAAGERTVRRHTVQPSLTGERLRLTYRLYERGSDSPLRRVQIWLAVESAS